jgi:uncharacterized membrane protein YuzA (DUF378 family)
MDSLYISKLFHKFALVLLVIGAALWGILGVSKINVLDRLLGKGAILSRVIYIFVGLAALSVAFNRDTYLPFLGESVFPCAVLSDQTPAGATRSIQVHVRPDSKVIFWASEPGDGKGTWKTAYRSYQNAGVATSDSSGVATLKVREPQGYTVPMKGYLEPHIHFRVCDLNGFVGRIKSVFLADGHVEGFQNY